MLYATRIQKERSTGEGIERLENLFRIGRPFVDAHCAPDVIVMHSLPSDSLPGAIDLAADIGRDPRLPIVRQTDNGIPVRMAIFAQLRGVDQLVQRSMRDARWSPPAQVGLKDTLEQLRPAGSRS